MQLVAVQTADNCTFFCTHVPKHLQYAQINKKFQSDVNKKTFRDLNFLFRKNYSFENWAKAIEKNCNNNIHLFIFI